MSSQKEFGRSMFHATLLNDLHSASLTRTERMISPNWYKVIIMDHVSTDVLEQLADMLPDTDSKTVAFD